MFSKCFSLHSSIKQLKLVVSILRLILSAFQIIFFTSKMHNVQTFLNYFTLIVKRTTHKKLSANNILQRLTTFTTSFKYNINSKGLRCKSCGIPYEVVTELDFTVSIAACGLSKMTVHDKIESPSPMMLNFTSSLVIITRSKAFHNIRSSCLDDYF